ncbi:UNVERIFIED_CONTAM: hypothetical protein HDU68_000209 [Siphonaria sp. JEL0065]|nr:hypothetical protein HDU68_000209 [Siphonaria sp. JEL0065]
MNTPFPTTGNTRNKSTQCTPQTDPTAPVNQDMNQCFDEGIAEGTILHLFADLSRKPKDEADYSISSLGLEVLYERFKRRRRILGGAGGGGVDDGFGVSDDDGSDGGERKRKSSRSDKSKKKKSSSSHHHKKSKKTKRRKSGGGKGGGGAASETLAALLKKEALLQKLAQQQQLQLQQQQQSKSELGTSAGGSPDGSSSETGSGSDSDEIDELDEWASGTNNIKIPVGAVGNSKLMADAIAVAASMRRSRSSSGNSSTSSSGSSNSSDSSSSGSSSDSDSEATVAKKLLEQKLLATSFLNATKSLQQQPSATLLSKLAKPVTKRGGGGSGSSGSKPKAVKVESASTPPAPISFGIVPKKPRARMWSQREDYQLVRAVRMYGNAWDRVELRVDGRNKKQCQDHWNRILSKKADNLRLDAVSIALQNSISKSKGGNDHQEISDEDLDMLNEDESRAACGEAAP